jgi:hypothetical protein
LRPGERKELRAGNRKAGQRAIPLARYSSQQGS